MFRHVARRHNARLLKVRVDLHQPGREGGRPRLQLKHERVQRELQRVLVVVVDGLVVLKGALGARFRRSRHMRLPLYVKRW